MDPILNPSNQVGILSFDAGSVYSQDGREHPLTALTPLVSVPDLPTFAPAPDPGQQSPQGAAGGTPTQAPTGTPGLPGSATVEGWLTKIFGTPASDPMGTGAAVDFFKVPFIRLGLGILALVLLVIVAIRVTGVNPIAAAA